MKPESKIVTSTDLKSSPGFFADLQKKRQREREREREREKVRKRERQRGSRRDASFIE